MPGPKEMNSKCLWEVKTITDDESGSVLCFFPILKDGAPDPVRLPHFRGECNVNNQTIRFEIKASSIEDAVKEFRHSLMAFVDEMQTQAMRHKLLTPGLVKPS